MKIVSLLAIITLCSSACSCVGDTCSYSYKFSYRTCDSDAIDTHIDIADGRNASGGSDGETAWPAQSSSGVLVGIYKTNGTDAWNGTTGFYGEDIRETLQRGNSITFSDIYLWATSGTESQDLHLRLQDGPNLDGVTLTLSLISVPNGVTYTGTTEWGFGTTDIVLPFYATNDGRTGYKFRITITAAQ